MQSIVGKRRLSTKDQRLSQPLKWLSFLRSVFARAEGAPGCSAGTTLDAPYWVQRLPKKNLKKKIEKEKMGSVKEKKKGMYLRRVFSEPVGMYYLNKCLHIAFFSCPFYLVSAEYMLLL